MGYLGDKNNVGLVQFLHICQQRVLIVSWESERWMQFSWFITLDSYVIEYVLIGRNLW